MAGPAVISAVRSKIPKALAIIYTDFAKAFDTVSHRMLLSKIKSYNIRIVLASDRRSGIK